MATKKAKLRAANKAKKPVKPSLLAVTMVEVREHVLQFRQQQAQTETHLARLTDQVNLVAGADGQTRVALVDSIQRVEALVKQLAEGFHVVQDDIAKLQKYVGAQTLALGKLSTPSYVADLRPPSINDPPGA